MMGLMSTLPRCHQGLVCVMATGTESLVRIFWIDTQKPIKRNSEREDHENLKE